MSVALQEKRTLDDVIKTSATTFNNGCDYRLVKEIDDKYYLEYGCYGVHVNLVTGDRRLLFKWFSKNNKEGNMRKLSVIGRVD